MMIYFCRACELENSFLIQPAEIDGNNTSYMTLSRGKKDNFLFLCTDMEQFKPFEERGLTTLTNSWETFLKLFKENQGIAISISEETCFIIKHFMKQYFGDKLNTS